MKKLLIMLAALWLLPLAAQAKPLVADLSQYHIDIDSDFNGTRLLLFGARNETGDIVVVVRGPRARLTVRKKEPVAGVWLNRRRQHFDNVPLFYLMATGKPLKDIKQSEQFADLEIGLREAVGKGKEEFITALLNERQRTRQYALLPARLSFMDESLFKLVLPFPDNLPRGDYVVDVYLFNDGQLGSMQSIPLHVDKTGFDALLYDFARNHGFLYGLCAVAVAIGMGWGASRLMNRYGGGNP